MAHDDELVTLIEAVAPVMIPIPWDFAHFFTGKGGSEVILSMTPALNGAQAAVKVSGKREARKVAARHSAKCWNF